MAGCRLPSIYVDLVQKDFGTQILRVTFEAQNNLLIDVLQWRTREIQKTEQMIETETQTASVIAVFYYCCGRSLLFCLFSCVSDSLTIDMTINLAKQKLLSKSIAQRCVLKSFISFAIFTGVRLNDSTHCGFPSFWQWCMWYAQM